MAGLEKCTQCGFMKDILQDGVCISCLHRNQDEFERREINATTIPEGFITTWNDSPSYLDKKNNYMYFRIPQTSTLFFDAEKIYQIIVKEVLI